MVMKKKLMAGAMAVTLCTTTAFAVQGATDAETAATEEETLEAIVISAEEDVQASEEVSAILEEESAEPVAEEKQALAEEEAVEEKAIEEQASIEINADQQIVLNGQALQGSFYENEDQVTMLPLREVAKALGYVVVWNPDERSAELFNGDAVAKAVLGSNSYVKADQVVNLAVAPELKDSLLYVPAAFFADILDVQVVSAKDTTEVTEEEAIKEEEIVTEEVVTEEVAKEEQEAVAEEEVAADEQEAAIDEEDTATTEEK